MKRIFLFIYVALLALILCQCSSKDEASSSSPEYNELVEGFTSGNISRKAPIYLILSSELDDDKMKKDVNDFLSISPSVKGKFSYEDSYTIVFKPEEELSRNTTYTVEAKLSKLFGKSAKDFKFSFSTHPLKIAASKRNFEITEDEQYIYNIDIRTLDEENLETVKKYLNIIFDVNSESAKNIEWIDESNYDKMLRITFDPTTYKSQFFKLETSEDQKLGLEKENLLTLDIPNSKDLVVTEIRYVMEDTKYIEVTFNKILDPNQNMKGLVYVDEQTCPVEVSANSLKIFPNTKNKNKVDLRLSSLIRSKKGTTLGSDYIQEVSLKMLKPAVEFIGNGTIIPREDKVTIPFRTVYLKGVKVKVYKIYSHNIGQFIVNSNLNGCKNLRFVGRPVAVTTFYMDDSKDLTQWNNYSIDISKLVKMDPGSIYRIELSMEQRLSAWNSDSTYVIDKDAIAKEDQQYLESLNEEFDDNSNYYSYYYYDDDYDYYYDDEDDDPEKSWYYTNSRKTATKNVLSTNIGLVAYSPIHNKMTVFASNLITANAYPDVTVELYNKQSHIIAKGTTDADGKAEFVYDGKEGAPFYVIATKDNDLSCMRVNRGEELSTSTFDVSGTNIQKGLKGYIYGERGVWRPGDTIHLSLMINDKGNTLPKDHPVVMTLSTPLGQLYKKMTKNNGQHGLYTFSVPTDPSVPTGSWLANFQVGGLTFSKYLRVETIKPNRLKIDLKLPNYLKYGSQICNLHTEWMTGSKTNGLEYNIKGKFYPIKTKIANYPDYVFDNMSKNFSSREESVASGYVDTEGNANVHFDLSVRNNASGKLGCVLTTLVYENSGEFSTDTRTIEYSPYNRYVGIKEPEKNKYGYLATGANHKYQVVLVGADGTPVSNANLSVTVKKTRYWWWWYSDSSDWAEYSNNSNNELVQSMDLRTDPKGEASFTLNFDDKKWGTYYITVTDKEQRHSASVKSYFDWPTLSAPRSKDERENSITLSLTTDKEEYHPGDKANITIPSTENSRAILTVCNSAGIVDMKFVKCVKGETSVQFDITEEMMPNAYITATLIQPYKHENNDVPIRLYGVTPIRVYSENSKLKPVIKADDEVRPMTDYTIKVSEQDGREMAYTLAVVDEGLLDLTHFETPNAWSSFNAKEAFGMRMWDLYGHVCGAFGGRIDDMFSIGGDDGIDSDKKSVINRFKPMVYFGGPFLVEKGGSNTHKISIPNYTGRVRVMVVATNGAAYGSAEKSTFVRKPLMVIGTMPRQIGVNDEMTVAATVFATDNSVKSATTTLSCSGNLAIVGTNKKTIEFTEPCDKTILFRVKAGNKGGTGRISIESASSHDKSSYVTDIEIRTVSQHVSKTETVPLEAGKTFDQTINAMGSEQQKIYMEISSIKPLNMTGRVSELIQYPHGCAEQISSQGLAQLYMDDFAQLSAKQKLDLQTNVKAVINRLPKYQTSCGGMAYWPGSRDDNFWVSSYVLLFLNKAAEKGYLVNDNLKKDLTKYVTSQVKLWKLDNKNDYDRYHSTSDAAFALYALACVNSPERGTMNRMKEASAKLSENDMYLLAASYALIGQVSTAKQIIKKTNSTNNYWNTYATGSQLIAETLTKDPNVTNTTEEIRKELTSNNYMSTFRTAMALQSMYTFYKHNNTSNEMKFQVTLDGKEFADLTTGNKCWSALAAKDKPSVKANIKNKSTGMIYVTTTCEGLAIQEPIQQMENGLSVVATRIEGDIEQGSTFNVTVTITNNTGRNLSNIAITHILPSGFETLSTENSSNISYQDVRDDRVLSYINDFGKGRQAKIELTLSATYAGSYYVPSVVAEDMYDNKVYGCSPSYECVVK